MTLDQALWDAFGWWGLVVFNGWPFIVWLTCLVGFAVTITLLVRRR